MIASTQYLKDVLLEFYTPDEAFEWLFSPQPLLGGECAIDVIRHEPERVFKVIQQMRDCVYV